MIDARRRMAAAALCVIVAGASEDLHARPAKRSPEPVEQIRQLLRDGMLSDAEERARRLLVDIRAAGDGESLEAAGVMDALVQVLVKEGQVRGNEARSLAQEALATRTRLLGPDDARVAASLARLAQVLDSLGDYPSAIAQYERAMSILEKAGIANRRDLARVLVSAGSSYKSLGDLTKARTCCERGLKILEKDLGPGHPDVANALNTYANVLKQAGDLSGAEAAQRRALAIYERSVGPEADEVGRSLGNLANVLRQRGRYEEATADYRRAIAITERVYGSEHQMTAQSQTGLASLYLETGDLARARSLYERILSITEKQLGREHPSVARDTRNLANALYALGDVESALDLHRRALAIREKTLGAEHPSVAISLANIAEILRTRGDAAGARPLQEKALAIRERALGPDHPDVARSLRGLALVLRSQGDDAGARPLFERALAIREKSLGADHNYTASSLTDLADQTLLMGEMPAARPLYERAIAIRERVVPGGIDLATSLRQYAAYLWYAGDAAAALERALEAEAMAREQFRRAARRLSEREAIAFESVRVGGSDVALTALQDLRGRPGLYEASDRVLDAVVRSRSMVLDEMAERHELENGSKRGDIARRRAALDVAVGDYARLLVRGPDEERPSDYPAELQRARGALDAAERDLAARSAGYRDRMLRKRIGLPEVKVSLPQGSVLVSYVLWARVPGRASEPPEPWYAAFVVRPDKKLPAVVPLGPAARIDALVERWRLEVTVAPSGLPVAGGPAERAYRDSGLALRRAVWDPLSREIEGARQVFIVPDGSLHLVSFATLPAGEGSYLVETLPMVHYLSAERDLAVVRARTRRGRGLFALGGPDFDARSTAAAPRPHALLRGSSFCDEIWRSRFVPLPGARSEIEEIGALWKSSSPGGRGGSGRLVTMVDSEAGEEQLKRSAPGFRIVHLATHGFFAPADRCPSLLESVRVDTRSGLRSEAAVEARRGGNPLLLSGLALAGANLREGGNSFGEDGILTAEEISSIDLSGVEWVVLSACESGVGTVALGEGVMGLRRAFEIAGAGTLIMSLWPVEDQTTRAWMKSLYARRLSGLSTTEAVRQAGLDAIEARRSAGVTTHPYYWGGFVAAGDYR